MVTEAALEKVRATLDKLQPETLQAMNELLWQGIRERCEELRNDDLRHQALDHLDSLIDLLRSEDDGVEGELA